MATPEQYVRAQNGAVGLALQALRALWRRLDLDDAMAVRAALEEFWPDMLATYGDVTATLAADRFEDLTRLPATLVRPVDPERALARMRWALTPLFTNDGDTLGRLELLTDELVKQPGRSTTIRSANDNRIRFARVPTGAETCSFCLMVASRGAVYGSEAKAGQHRKYHGRCDCRIEPLRDDLDLERLKADGYNPDELYDKYLTAADNADGNSLKATLAELRQQEGTH